MKKYKTLLIIGALAVLGGGLLVFQSLGPSKYDSFAQCLGDAGATFYGAFWCPHCAEQKALFGNAEKYLPYVECSTPDRQGQLDVCIDAEIMSYPTWEFKDGSRLTGPQPLKTLAEETGCELP